MFRPGHPARKSAPLLAVGLTTILGFSAGCGGGGGGSSSPPSHRAVLINAVQAARLSANIFRVPDYVEEEALNREVVSRVRSAFARTRAENDGEGFDAELGLYYRYITTDAGFKIAYHHDAARTNLAGYIEFRQESETNYQFIFRLPDGNDPFVGDMNLVLDAPDALVGRLSGDVRDPRTGERVVFDFRVETDRITEGSFTARSPGMRITFEDFTATVEGALSSDIRYGTLTGSVEQNPDTSGRLTLTDTTGTFVAEYDAEGKGTIRLPNGQAINIPDFDLDDTEK